MGGRAFVFLSLVLRRTLSHPCVCALHHIVSVEKGSLLNNALFYHPCSLIKQNKSYIQDIHSERSVNEFVKIIQKTDFDGVSGRINFVNNQHSRLSNVKVYNIFQNYFRFSVLYANFSLHCADYAVVRERDPRDRGVRAQLPPRHGCQADH